MFCIGLPMTADMDFGGGTPSAFSLLRRRHSRTAAHGARPSAQIDLWSGDDDPAVGAECLAARAFAVAMKGGHTDILCETVDRACAATAAGATRPGERVFAAGRDSGV